MDILIIAFIALIFFGTPLISSCFIAYYLTKAMNEGFKKTLCTICIFRNCQKITC